MSDLWQPPKDYRSRPVVILGAGVLGRRIACIWASAGYNVRVRDPSPEQRAACVTYVQENVALYAANITDKVNITYGGIETFEDLKEALGDAWLVVEAVPEKIQLKIDTFQLLDHLAPADCILASNSSSFRSSEMLLKVTEATKARLLNLHYYMPPQVMVVELMTCGFTEKAIFQFMVDRSREAGTVPYVARKESTGFIFNRLWAAVKREVLTILSEKVSVPEEIDSIWSEMFIKGRFQPCRGMDSVGLDTVAFIENHYIAERSLSPEKTVNFLQNNYLDQGRLGSKSSKGGLYPPPEATNPESKMYVLDIGLSAKTPNLTAGEILQVSSNGSVEKIITAGQAYPDGITVDTVGKRIFWTTMGVPGKPDGAVYTSNLDGTEIQTVVAPGVLNTPKQIAMDSEAKKLYVSDREGLRVARFNLDGSDFEVLIRNGDWATAEDSQDLTKWCVGVAVVPSLGKFFWTQKGPSKGGKGAIYCANITTPENQSVAERNDIQCIRNNLPEPIDLDFDEKSSSLYWTDRGELPYGNSLNRIRLDAAGVAIPSASPRGYEILCRNLNEAIGLTLDLRNNTIYLTDLGGNIYKCDSDGKNRVKLYSNENRAFTGIAFA
ncbi:hypothetical protein UA08_02939 [Talaromyces atroroseus]|uniref:3-hydroxyacyl-CoA dehydrogenase n=1 Tax=Talaromyces atroroseus TaxID=1441469 RepID=A0A225AKF9_TALAT|nr:hypothetical protein UA08_02939 [Talaromyces atroroseus]OKL62041.1 hypothetical protein UA08_02939 [Talaromyces atroroseus]